MLEWFQASTYRTTTFVLFLREYFQNNPCLLCGRIHRLYIHYYVGRLIRNADTEKNEEIVICVIICHSAKRAGTQYTKRILPPFVSPECNITLENAFRMFEVMPDGQIYYSIAATLLGTVCKKTIQRHFGMVCAYTEVAVSLLAEYLALDAPFINLPEQPPSNKLFALLLLLMQVVCELQIQRSGRYCDPPPALLYLHPVYVFKKSRSTTTGKNLLNLVSGIRFYFDTS
jgi:hypothetical protein